MRTEKATVETPIDLQPFREFFTHEFDPAIAVNTLDELEHRYTIAMLSDEDNYIFARDTSLEISLLRGLRNTILQALGRTSVVELMTYK